jgi:hypothetical protein
MKKIVESIDYLKNLSEMVSCSSGAFGRGKKFWFGHVRRFSFPIVGGAEVLI